MPWVDKERCIGCAICVQQCPADAISLRDGKAEIDMEKCIRCGKCHEGCPQDAVRHDSERIPQRVEENLKELRDIMNNFRALNEKRAFIERIKRHYLMEKKVAEKTLAEIENIKDNTD